MLEYVLNTSTDAKQPPNDVEQSWGASAKLLGRRPPRHWTGRGQLNESGMFGEWRVLLFVLVVCMGGWEWMCEWMSLRCPSCAQTLDRGERCLAPDLQCPRLRHHQAPVVRVTWSHRSATEEQERIQKQKRKNPLKYIKIAKRKREKKDT